MAKIESAFIDGKIDRAVNVSRAVGYGMENLRDDVMLIQGLFNYIANALSPQTIGLGGVYQVPEINGVMDADTYTAIGQFQIQNSSQLLMKRFDGVIHPASYKNRRLHSIGKQMSIVLLHLKATDAALMSGDIDYQRGMANLNSDLARLIDWMIINP
jgi:hypothetical protein